MTRTPSVNYLAYADQVPYSGGSALDEQWVQVPDPRRSLDRAIRTIWRWRRHFFFVFGGVAAFGMLLLLILPLRYTAEALVMVGTRELNPLTSDQGGRDSRGRELDVDGQIQIVTSHLALQHVAAELNLAQNPAFRSALADNGPGIFVRLRTALSGGEYIEPKLDPADVIATSLQRHLQVERLGRSAMLRIRYTARNPQLAAAIANAIAENSAVDNEFHSRLSITERAGFELLTTWVTSPARVPIVPSSPNLAVVLIATLIVALCAAFSAVMFADYRAARFLVSSDQIVRRGVRALGFIPVVDRFEDADRSPVTIVSEQPDEAFSDSIAALRASLDPLTPRDGSNCLVLLFSSALPAEGKSTTVAALATSIATSGGRVLLIDADLRSPSLHRAFDASLSPGLTNCRDSNADLDSLIQVDVRSGVCLLAAGPYDARPLDVLSAPQLHQAIAHWRSLFDVILIDAPPVLGMADARVLVPMADYCVFVVRWGKTGWEAINHGLRVLTEAGAKIAGVAVSRVNAKQFIAQGRRGAEFYNGFYGREMRNRAA